MARSMSDVSQRVLKNTVFRVSGYAIGAGLFFAATVLIARYLGAEGFGHFAFVMALVGIFQLVADMGVRNILIRDIARDREHFRRYLVVARTLLWGLSVISLGCIVALANLLQLTDEVRQATYIAGLAVVAIFQGLGYSAVLRAFEEMEWDILGFGLHKVVLIVLVWSVTHTTFGLRGVCTVILLANLCQWGYFWGLVGIRHGWARPRLDIAAAWALLAEAFPLGMAESLRRLTRHIDRLLLTALGTPMAVGLFSAAYKFLEAVMSFTVHLTLPLFPVFVRFGHVSPDRLAEAYERSLKFLYVMGVPLAVLLFVLSEHIVVLFFGPGYREAAVTLRILAPAVVLLLPTALYSYVFTALGRQRLYLGCIAIALAVNTLFDLLLIPLYGHAGAAVGTLMAEAALFLSGLLMLRRFGSSLTSVRLLWRPLLAGLALWLCCWLVQDRGFISVVGGSASGLVAYAGVLFLLQTFTPQERALLRDAMHVRLLKPVRH